MTTTGSNMEQEDLMTSDTDSGEDEVIPPRQPRVRDPFQRDSVPYGPWNHMFNPSFHKTHTRLWVTDRVLEPQTISRFLDFLSHGRLPSGRTCLHRRPTEEEIKKIRQPFTEWAIHPFNKMERSALDSVMMRFESAENSSLRPTISAELRNMKARLWAGIVPLSERRWKELKLDDRAKFYQACNYLSMVTTVFFYLDDSEVRKALRKTFNIVSSHLRVYEGALNAQRREDAQGRAHFRVTITGLWHDWIVSLYRTMTTTAHNWVIEHIERLWKPLAEELKAYAADDFPPGDICDRLQCLLDNGLQADTMICIPMDGYSGDYQPTQPERPPGEIEYQEEIRTPVTFTPDTTRRRLDYAARLRYLIPRKIKIEQRAAVPASERSDALFSYRGQAVAQAHARQELRGEREPGREYGWLDEIMKEAANPDIEWGFVGYRLCSSRPDSEWKTFEERFEADTSNWGSEYSNIDAARNICKIHWVDGHGLNIEDGDLEAAKQHFNGYVGSDGAPRQIHRGVFLVADDEVVRSYLQPDPEQEGFILAVDAKFDPESPIENESQGYTGVLRLLGSLLWDDVGAMLHTKSRRLIDLWPLAMGASETVYRGPNIGPVEGYLPVPVRQPEEDPESVRLRVGMGTIFAALKRMDYLPLDS